MLVLLFVNAFPERFWFCCSDLGIFIDGLHGVVVAYGG